MRVSETFITIMNISGILIGIAATIYSSFLYVQTYRHGKNIHRSTIGLLNLAICVSMIMIVLTAFVAPDANNTPFIVRATLISMLLIGFFVIFQTVYLFSPQSPMKRVNLPERGKKQILPESGDSHLKRLKKIEEILRRYLQKEASLKYLQIFDMSFPLTTTKMYIPTKVYPEPLQFSSEQMETLEEQFTPLDRLNKKLEILEKRDAGAIDPLQIFVYQNKKQCVLLGEPGIGKTTYLKFLTISQSTNVEIPTNNFLPLYIALNDYANSSNWNLLDYIVEVYRRRYFSKDDEELLRELITKKLEDGTAFILLDGLDETLIGSSAKATYNEVCNKVGMFAGMHENAHIIVTSRKTSYELGEKLTIKNNTMHGQKFKCLEIAGFLRNDVRNFVKQWFEERPSDDEEITTENLLLKLEQDSRLRELSHNPLLLSILTLAYSRRMKITHRRAKLYDDCTTALLKDWDKSRTIVRTNKDLLAIQNELPELKIAILQELAWYFHNLELCYFSREDALVVIDELLKRRHIQPGLKEEILDEIIINSGLLKRDSAYSFSHITFQEYFAAKYMLDAVENGQHAETELLNKWYDPRWEEVILLYAGLTAKLGSVLTNLRSPDRNDIYHSNILFAGRCIAAASTQSQKHAHETIQDMYTILHEITQKHLADRIANTLIEIANQDVNLSLMNMLGAKFDKQDFGDDLFMVPENLVKGMSIIARTSIAEALGTCSDRSVPGKLRDLLVDEQAIDNDTLRSSIVYTLSKLGDKSVAMDLVNYLSRPSRDGDRDQLHISIIDALRSLREPSVIPQLCDCLVSRHVSDNGKIKIAETLGILGSLIETQEMRNRLSGTLLQVIRDQNIPIHVRYSCVGTFGKWRYPEAVFDLQTLLTNLDSWSLRSRIAVVLNLVGEESIQPDVPDFLSNEDIDQNVRNELVQFLTDQIQFLPDKNASSLVSKLISPVFNKHKINPNVRGELAEALGIVGNDQVAQKFSKYLAETASDHLVQGRIVVALGKLCDRGKLKYGDLIPILRTFLENPNTDIDTIQSCAEVISEIGTLEDMGLARTQLLDTTRKVRMSEKLPEYILNQNIILAALDDHTVLNQLKEILLYKKLILDMDEIMFDVSEKAQERIVKSLIALKNRSIVPELQEKLRDTTFSLDTRRCLVKIIKRIGSDADTCKVLWDVMDKETIPDLKEDIYEAIWEISRREGLRVYWNTASSSIQVEKVKPLEMELPAAAGSQA